MAKKTKPSSSLSSEEIYSLGERLEPRERAFWYGLYLTGARTNELAQINKADIFEKEGVWHYKYLRSKLRTIDPTKRIHKAPFILMNESDEKMFSVFMDWVKSRPEGRVFDYTPSVRELKWKAKDGTVRTRTISVYKQPYHLIVEKAGISSEVEVGGELVERQIPLHFLRSFAITNSIEINPTNPQFTQQRIGHKSLGTTLGYLVRSGAKLRIDAEELEKQGKVRLARKDK